MASVVGRSSTLAQRLTELESSADHPPLNRALGLAISCHPRSLSLETAVLVLGVHRRPTPAVHTIRHLLLTSLPPVFHLVAIHLPSRRYTGGEIGRLLRASVCQRSQPVPNGGLSHPRRNLYHWSGRGGKAGYPVSWASNPLSMRSILWAISLLMKRSMRVFFQQADY